MARAETTLLIIEPTRVTRADVGAPGDKTPPRVYRQPRLGNHGLADVTRAALALAPGCGKGVWVAADEIWSQTLTLPLAAVSNFNEAELGAALAFEAEPLSGIPSTGAALGFSGTLAGRKDGFKDFAVLAMDSAWRDEIQASIKKAGGKLRGICNLKNLPPLVDDAENDWLTKCAADLEGAAPIPRIAPAPQKISPARYWIFALAFEAAMVAFCFFHWRKVTTAETDAIAAAKELRAPQALVDALKVKNDAAKVELKKLTDENTFAASLQNGTEHEVWFQRQRIPLILRNLTASRPKDIAITGIQTKDVQTLNVEGFSVDPALVDTYASQLESTLRPIGLLVQSQSKTAQNIAKNGGPWKFVLQIQNTIETPKVVAPAKRPGTATTAKNIPAPSKVPAPAKGGRK